MGREPSGRLRDALNNLHIVYIERTDGVTAVIGLSIDSFVATSGIEGSSPSFICHMILSVFIANCKRTCYDIYAKTARFTKLNYGQEVRFASG